MPADRDYAAGLAGFLDRRLSADLVADRPRWTTERRAALTQLADLAFTPVVLDEKVGGLGLGAADMVTLFQEAGARLLPLPLLDAAVSAAVVANAVGDPHSPLARAVVDGSHVGFLAPSGATLDGDGALTTGALLVEAADIAVGFVVRCADGDGPAIVYLPAGATGVAVEPAGSVDPCRPLFAVTFHGARGEVLLSGAPAAGCAATLTTMRRLATAAEVSGVMRACLANATEYALLRRQFGRPIGSFQAHKHLLATCWRDCYAVDSICEAAAEAVDRGEPGAGRLALAAKAWAARVGLPTVEQTLQAFGAVAFTAEHPHHLYLKRMLTLHGQEGEHADLLAEAGRGVLSGRGAP